MSSSGSSSSSTLRAEEENSYPSSSSATEATHSSSSASHSHSTDSSEHSSASSSLSTSASHSGDSASDSDSDASSSASAPSSPAGSKDDDKNDNDGSAPLLKLPRLEEVDKLLHPGNTPSGGTAGSAISRNPSGGASIFPAPLPAPLTPPQVPSGPPPRYGPIFPAPPPFHAWAAQTPPPPPPPPAPPLPTLSAAAKDLTEVDVRAGVRLGVYRAATRLNKEQVMDEIESVRMTSSVERVLLEPPSQPSALPGVPVEEREYAWATVFFADAEAAELCAARLCQPGRRSKWPRVCIQRLPPTSLLSAPLTSAESERYRVHAYQLESAASTPGAAAAVASALTDTVLARSADGWCLLSTGALYPTLGLATYLKHRRGGDFSGVEVCAKFQADAAMDTCSEGGKCAALHLRESEQWKLLLPVVRLPVTNTASAVTPGRTSVGNSPHVKPAPANTPPAAVHPLSETPWQQARHADCLLVNPLPNDIDETSFVYMFRGCRGYVRAQTVRTFDQGRYGVVQFADAARAQEARREAAANSALVVRFYGEVSGGTSAPPSPAPGTATKETSWSPSGTPDNAAIGTCAPHPSDENGSRESFATPGKRSADGAAEKDVTSGGPGGGATHDSKVPFPPLPEGWEYGLSRRTMQYFFTQLGKKSTTWKHPVTQEQYKAKR